jgi:hypothetical protein
VLPHSGHQTGMGTLGRESISIISVVRPVIIVRPVFGHLVRMSGIGDGTLD